MNLMNKKNILLSVVMPAYNEEETIESVIRIVEKVDLSKLGVKK